MVAKRGSELKLLRGDGATPTEVFTLVGAVQTTNWSKTGAPINVTTGDDVDVNGEIWETFITGPKNGTFTASGIAKSLLPIQSIEDDFRTGAIVNYQIDVPNVGVDTAAFVVTDLSYEGPYDGVCSFNLTLQLAGAPTFVAAV
jgi:predicted secreted protein